MRQNFWCLLFLIVCLTAVLVKSQSFVEVDEDGNEIEVKRFYIEGRQLNGGRRQCVETRRRKRAYNYGQADEAANDEIPTSPETAASNINTAVSMDEEDEDEDKDNEPIGLIGLYNDTNINEDQNMEENNDGEAEEEDEKEEGNEKEEAEPMLSLPVIAQITHSNSQQQQSAVSQQQQSAVAASASAGDNDIVIVNTNKPPKVNPQTHAVFELRPVQADEAGDDENEDDDYDDDEQANLVYHEEISPVSTTAIWSTGEDDDRLADLYDDYGAADNNGSENDNDDNDDGNNDSGEDNSPSKPKPKPKPPKKPSKRPSKRPTRKPSKKPGKHPARRPSKNKKKNKKNKKTSLKRKTNSKHRRPGNKNKRVPGKRGQGNNKRRRQNNRPYRGQKQKLSNSRRGQLNNLHAHNQGTNTYSKTETFTRTGTPNDEKDVNCIIINKTTTPRPFWGLLGRSADGDATAVAPTERPYGRRKRINFSIPA